MGKIKPVILPVLTSVMLAGQGVAIADKGGNGRNNAAIPSANLGFAAVPMANSQVGLPAGALNAPGKALSAPSAGLAPPGKTNEPDRGASGKGASLTGASHREARLSELPTCR